MAGSGYIDPRCRRESNAVLTRSRRAAGGSPSSGATTSPPTPCARQRGRPRGRPHLLELGHRRIGVAPVPRLTTVADRLAGVEAAFTAHGLTLDDLPVLHTDFTRNGGHAAAEHCSPSTPTSPR